MATEDVKLINSTLIKGCKNEPQAAANTLNPYVDDDGAQLSPDSWTREQICNFFERNGKTKFAAARRADTENDWDWTALQELLGYDESKWNTKYKPDKDELKDWGLSGMSYPGIRKLMMKLEPNFMSYEEKSVTKGVREQIMYFQRSVKREVVDVSNDIFEWDSAREVTAVEVCKGVLGAHYDEVMTKTLAPMGIRRGQKGKDKDGMEVDRLENILAAKLCQIKGSFVLDEAYNMNNDGMGLASYFVFYLSRKGEPKVCGKDKNGNERYTVDHCLFDVSIVGYRCDYRMKPSIHTRVTSTRRWGFLFGILGGIATSTTTVKEWRALSDEQRETLECFFKTRALSRWRSSGFLKQSDLKSFAGKRIKGSS